MIVSFGENLHPRFGGYLSFYMWNFKEFFFLPYFSLLFSCSNYSILLATFLSISGFTLD